MALKLNSSTLKLEEGYYLGITKKLAALLKPIDITPDGRVSGDLDFMYDKDENTLYMVTKEDVEQAMTEGKEPTMVNPNVIPSLKDILSWPDLVETSPEGQNLGTFDVKYKDGGLCIGKKKLYFKVSMAAGKDLKQKLAICLCNYEGKHAGKMILFCRKDQAPDFQLSTIVKKSEPILTGWKKYPLFMKTFELAGGTMSANAGTNEDV